MNSQIISHRKLVLLPLSSQSLFKLALPVLPSTPRRVPHNVVVYIAALSFSQLLPVLAFRPPFPTISVFPKPRACTALPSFTTFPTPIESSAPFSDFQKLAIMSPKKKTTISPKKEDLERNWVIERIDRGLKWLFDTSNLGKTEVDAMKDDLEDVKRRAQGDKDLPTKAMRDLTLKEVETVFRITQVTPGNAKTGDN